MTALAIILAAAIAGFFALRNENNQATQERLLKAVELIMASRNGYQANMRRQNLDNFLDDATRKYIEEIKNNFSGSELTELNVDLAQAMSDKVTTPEEVLNIWQCVLKEKKIFHKIAYSGSDQTNRSSKTKGD